MDINTAIHEIRNPLNAIAMNAELARLIIETKGDMVKAINALDAICDPVIVAVSGCKI